MMGIKRIKKITAEEENFRVEPADGNVGWVRRDPIEPVPVGTYIVKVFKVTGYDQDCDGSLMARIACVDKEGQLTGWEDNCIGLYPDSTWEVEWPSAIDDIVANYE